jgi:RimJ/RimL family protein N-acetyltransferase
MSEVDIFPRGAWVQLGIASRSTNELIGDAGICVSADDERAEVGFTIARDAQSVGLGTEAVRALIHFIFEHTYVTAVVAVTDERNVQAHRLLLRVGMRNVEIRHAVFRGAPCIEHIWTISRADARDQSAEDR